jgi:hypothetical protein
LRSHQRISSDDARFPNSLALCAENGSLIVFKTTVLTILHLETLVNVSVHVDIQNPISDVVSLLWTDQVLIWKGNFEW